VVSVSVNTKPDTVPSPRNGPPRFLAEGCMTVTKSGLACVYCV